MSLQVYTARFSYSGSDRVDITRVGGSVFAPSWGLLNPCLRLRKLGQLTGEHFARYREDYVIEMRESYRRHYGAWRSLLTRREATLCCYCREPARCHRTILAEILAHLGAEYRGERPKEEGR